MKRSRSDRITPEKSDRTTTDPPAKRIRSNHQARSLIASTFFEDPDEFESLVRANRAQQILHRVCWQWWPFPEGILGKEKFCKKMASEDREPRKAKILKTLLERSDRGHCGSYELQFLMDHVFTKKLSRGGAPPEAKALEILSVMFREDWACDLALWWKERPDPDPDAPKHYGKKLTFEQQMEWFQYYQREWSDFHDGWSSFMWGIAGACFFHQRFLNTSGCPIYLSLKNRE